MMQGIDVSAYQGKIDWQKVKASGIKFAILRCGFGSDMAKQDDSQFKRNADECARLGIPFGVYLFSYANTKEKAKSEADHVLRLVKGMKLSYPIFYDLEDADTTQKCSAKEIGDFAEIFCNAIEKAGYKPAIYANKYWFTSILTDSRFNKWDKWVAQYASKCTYSGKYTMWQYSSKGSVPGIAGSVDMNLCYVDYPSMILGCEPTPKPVEKKGYSGTFPTLPSRGYFQKGDKGTQVKNLQNYLLWYGCKLPKYGADGSLGDETISAVKAFQKAEKLTADGLFGKNSLAAAKKVKK